MNIEPVTSEGGERSPSATLAGFIVGMSRAGTQWMCKCLNEHPDVAAFGESKFFGRHYVEPAEDGLYHEAQLGAMRRRLLEHGSFIHSTTGTGPGTLKRLSMAGVEGLVAQTFPVDGEPLLPGEAFRRLAQAVAKVEGKPLAIEKTPHHLNWTDRMLAAVPEARFIVMVREPYSFMLSWRHQGDRFEERIRRAFARRYHPAAIAMIWKTSMRAATGAVARRPDRMLLVRFEDLRADPHATLERVQRFLGLRVVNLAEAVPPDNTSFPGGRRPDLHAEDIFWMNRIAGSAIRAHGYSLRRTPFGPLRIAWSSIRLPWWAVRNYLSLRSRVAGSTFGYLLRWLRPGLARDTTNPEIEA